MKKYTVNNTSKSGYNTYRGWTQIDCEDRHKPEGRRNIGRPKKRWRDQLHFED